MSKVFEQKGLGVRVETPEKLLALLTPCVCPSLPRTV